MIIKVLTIFLLIRWQACQPNIIFFGTLKDVGQAMINCVVYGSDKKVLETKNIVELAKKSVV